MQYSGGLLQRKVTTSAVGVIKYGANNHNKCRGYHDYSGFAQYSEDYQAVYWRCLLQQRVTMAMTAVGVLSTMESNNNEYIGLYSLQ